MERKMAHLGGRLLPILLLVGLRSAWGAGVPLDGQAMAAELTRVWQDAPGASGKAARLEGLLHGLSGDEAAQTRLLLGVARERAGDTHGALEVYSDLAKGACGSPLCESALFRQEVIEKAQRPVAAREAAMKRILAQADSQGWFLESSQWRWEWMSKRRAARLGLVDLRSSQLSFALFSFLQRNSPWDGPLAFLGVLATLSVGAKILEFPLLIRSMQTAGRLVAFNPQIKRIQEVYSNDTMESGKQVMRFYAEHGVSLKSGCLMALADMIFVVWALISLSDFAPQLALDGSALWWMSDVTRPDTKILLIWALVSGASTLMFAQAGQRAQTVGTSVLSGIVFCLIAYYWKWPAYVMIFWTMLNLTGVAISILFWPVKKSAQANAE
jgi:membrane protein insertase Oxa1/YidC/SpoIIIJ